MNDIDFEKDLQDRPRERTVKEILELHLKAISDKGANCATTNRLAGFLDIFRTNALDSDHFLSISHFDGLSLSLPAAVISKLNDATLQSLFAFDSMSSVEIETIDWWKQDPVLFGTPENVEWSIGEYGSMVVEKITFDLKIPENQSLYDLEHM